MTVSISNWLILAVLLIIATLLLASCSVLKVEKQPYTVLQKEGSFEVRNYPSYIQAQTLIASDFEQAGNIAFRRLFGYIDGKNISNQKIDMTSPVNQKIQDNSSQKISMTAPVNQQQSGDSWVVSFIMPAKYSIDTLPKPQDANVVLVQMPSQKMAAIRYRGSWTQTLYDKKQAELKEFIAKKSLTISGSPIWSRYNPPFYPAFMRRNEILFPIE